MSIVGWLFLCLAVFIGLRHIHPSGILFYQGVFVGLAVVVIQYLIQRDWKDAAIVFLLFYSFFFTVPVTVDRSYSVRMIEQVVSSPNGVRQQDIASRFEHYFESGDGVSRRIEEQLVTGSIKMQNGRIVATPVGRLLAQSFRFIAAVFVSKNLK